MQGIEDRAGSVQSIVLQELEKTSVVSIGAGFESKRNDAAGESVLCSLIVVNELELAYRIDGRMISAYIATQVSVRDGNAVDVHLIRKTR